MANMGVAYVNIKFTLVFKRFVTLVTSGVDLWVFCFMDFRHVNLQFVLTSECVGALFTCDGIGRL